MTTALRAKECVQIRIHRAFTLTETLVVVGLIAIVATLLIPTFESTLNQSTTAEDVNKLKQISTAMHAFAVDNGGRLPHANIPLSSPIPSSESYVWAEAVDRYFDPVPSFWERTSYNWVNRPNSPFFSKACDPFPGFAPSSRYPLWKRPIAFSYNRNLNDPRWEGYLNRIPQPSKTVVVAEVNGVNTTPMSPNGPAVTSSDVQATYRVSRRNNTALYLFADGHVESLQGDRGRSYFQNNPNETNMWYWW